MIEAEVRGNGDYLQPMRAASGPAQETTAAPDVSVETLYRQTAPAMRVFVKRLVGSASDAEDIVQEAFVKGWAALAAGAVDRPRAFLFRAARNLALNHMRNARVRRTDSARASIEDAFNRPLASAEEQFIASEEAAACQRVLEKLPTRCREAFVLRVVEELSYKEMSRHMNLSVSTIEKHVGKGKQIFRSRLGRHGEPGVPDPRPPITVVRGLEARNPPSLDVALALAAE